MTEIRDNVTVGFNVDETAGVEALNRLDRRAAEVQARMQQLGGGVGTTGFDKAAKATRAYSAQLDETGQIMRTTARSSVRMADGTKVAVTQTERLGQTMGRANRRSSRFLRTVRSITAGLLVWRGMGVITDMIRGTIDAQASLSIEVARFATVTDQSIGSAMTQYRELQSVLTEQGIKPSEAGGVVGLAARFAPEDTSGQREFLRVSGMLSNVFGVDIKRASEILAAALKQQNIAVEDSATVLDQLISVAREVPRGFGDISNAMTEATTIQEKWGSNFTDTLGLIADVAAAADESAEVTVNAFIRITDQIGRLEGDKFVEFVESMRKMGIDVQTATGELLDPLAVILQVSEGFSRLSAENQSQALIMLNLLKPTYQQVGRNLMKALADGQIDSLDVIAGAGEEAGRVFLESYGGALRQLEASREEVFQTGTAGQNLLASVTTGLAPLLGRQAVQGATDLNKAAAGGFVRDAESAKEAFLQTLTGLTPTQAEEAIREYNLRIAAALTKEFQSLSIIDQAFKGPQITEAGAALVVTKEESQQFITGLSEQSKEVIEAVDGWLASFGLDRHGEKITRPETTGAAQAPSAEAAAPVEIPIAERLRNRILADQEFLPSDPVDLTKLSMEEFNTVLRESEQIFNLILEAQIEQMRLAGLTAEQIDKQVSAIRDAAEETLVLVELEGKRFEIVSGIQAVNLQDATRRKEKAGGADSSFAFRRIKDIDPSQFGQLQALTGMYNQFLTQIGSPEKEKDINLLLGEENVFRQMNARMTALQLAMEDLTKVEKAQLSGVWNLPAGATALVPLQSLNMTGGGGGGGGMSPEQIMQLMSAFAQAAPPTAPAVSPGQDMREARRAPVRMRRLEDEESGFERQLAVKARAGRIETTPTRITRPEQDVGPVKQRPLRVENVVNVALEPIKATLNVNIPVLLNGQVIARVVQAMFFRLMTRAARSTTSGTGDTLGEVR